MGSNPYVVRQGDFLDKLAHAMGFDADTVWKDAANAELAGSRDPDVLLPGDILYLPDAAPRELGLAGGTSNDYAAAIPTTTIQLVFQDASGPLAGEPYMVEGLGEPTNSTAGGDGSIKIDVPVTLREVRLTLTNRGLVYTVGVGDMDPIDDDAGARKRLQNLLYRELDFDAAAAGDLDRCAIASFQRAHGMDPTGTLDDATKAAIVAAHGS